MIFWKPKPDYFTPLCQAFQWFPIRVEIDLNFYLTRYVIWLQPLSDRIPYHSPSYPSHSRSTLAFLAVCLIFKHLVFSSFSGPCHLLFFSVWNTYSLCRARFFSFGSPLGCLSFRDTFPDLSIMTLPLLNFLCSILLV